MNGAIPWKLSRSSVTDRRMIPIHYLMLDCCNGATAGKEPTTADATGLRRFIENVMLPWIENRKKELANRPLIGLRRGARPRQAGAARPLRGSSRSQARTHAHHAVALEGPAAGSGRGLTCLAKQRAWILNATRRPFIAPASGGRSSSVSGRPLRQRTRRLGAISGHSQERYG